MDGARNRLNEVLFELQAHDGEVRAGHFTLHVLENELRIGERTVRLRRAESDLLYLLLARAGKVVPFDALRGCLPRPKTSRKGSLAVHIHSLRSKIETDPTRPRHLITIRERGYLLKPESGAREDRT